MYEYTNYLLILLSISYRLLSIEVINGSLPTREVYQYNHRWSVAHNVKILSKEQKCRILSKRNDRRKSNKTISLKDAFNVYSYNLTCWWSTNNLANKPDFNLSISTLLKVTLNVLVIFQSIRAWNLSRFELQSKS